ncbi:beta-lactamase regulating signal transducer with metallopeptidase domain [Caulobacter ginsengisoli]|uniref:Beta-lactamase regulating signal transducer with metallopeptidase domain n=1 Tax=Caulobacter ginsengisoli TaxID=400775 RepID=A0ABU0IKG3_9CAUL|nr:M56 family metallopeptidase [Caulobacter ginsengisoli]MDQ0462506.1 beta-lactamase regulating signal transducer with metallopeptidase domain [Caulobacter ginsengisoli]
MSALAPTIVVALAATLPAAALAWLAGTLAERLALTAAARAMVWRTGLGLTVLTMLATPLGLLRRVASAAPQVHATIAAAGPAKAAPAAIALPRLDPASLIDPLALLLAAGMLVGLGGLLVRSWRVERLRRRARPVSELAHIAIPVLASQEAGAALLVGLMRPAIILPERLLAQLSADDLALICAHELAHLRRRDNWRILADQALSAVLWFNPPAHLCIARLVALREEICDATVLAGAGEDLRRRYAVVLLAAMRLAGAGGAQPAFIRKQGSEHAMRFKAILSPAGPSSRRALAAAAGLMGVAAVSTGLIGAAFAQPLAGVAADASRRTVKAGDQTSDAAGYQRACASGEARDSGFCTGVIFAVLSAKDSGVCQPTTNDYIALEKQARAAIAAATPEAAETPRLFVTRALKGAFACEKTGDTSSGIQITSDRSRTQGAVTTFEGSPTVRVIGPLSPELLLVNGRRPAEGFDVNALPAGSIERIVITNAGSRRARALGAGPGQSVMNVVLKGG